MNPNFANDLAHDWRSLTFNEKGGREIIRQTLALALTGERDDGKQQIYEIEALAAAEYVALLNGHPDLTMEKTGIFRWARLEQAYLDQDLVELAARAVRLIAGDSVLRRSLVKFEPESVKAWDRWQGGLLGRLKAEMIGL